MRVFHVGAESANDEGAASATLEEIMEVLKRCAVQGVQSWILGVPILAEKIASKNAPQP